MFICTLCSQYRKDGSAFEAIIPVFDWIHENDDISTSLNESAGASSSTPSPPSHRQSTQSLDYGGDALLRSAMNEMDRIAMNPSHFVSKLEILEIKTKRPKSEDHMEENEDEEEEENWELPPLTEQEMKIRNAHLSMKKVVVAPPSL